MPKYVDADALLEQMKLRRFFVGRSSDPICIIEDAPAADVAEVRHGRWVRATGMMPPEAFGVYECSLCGYTQDYHIPVRMREKTPFCPGCGAKLVGYEMERARELAEEKEKHNGKS